MRALDLDFARSRRRPPLAAWVLAAVGLSLSALAVWQWQGTRQRLVDAADAVAAARAQIRTLPKAQADVRQAQGRQAATLLGTPWAARLSALEGSRIPGVALIAVSSSASRGELEITAEARRPEAMLEYLARLQQLPDLASVSLASHAQATDESGQMPVVRFVLRGAWR